MNTLTKKCKIKQLAGTKQLLSNKNPLLLEREIGFETDTGKFKIAEANGHWNTLPYTSDKLIENNIKINDIVIPDCGSWTRKFYNSKTDNYFWAYDKRYSVKGVIYNSEGTITNSNVQIRSLFDGIYDNVSIQLPAGGKLVITIDYGGAQ